MKTFLFAVAILSCQSLFADDANKWIEQLNSEKFIDREKASEELKKLGAKAIPELTKAAMDGPLEVTVRSIDLLKHFTESEDKQTVAQAKESLTKISESDNTGAARRAKNALSPPKPAPQPVPQIRPFGNRVVIQGNVGMKIRVTNTNGVKTIEASDGKQDVKIVEDPKDGIKMEVTETKNGKKTTEKFAAKNADELKKKHPDAHAIYQKYANGNLGAVRFGARIGGLPRAIPAVPGRAAARANNTRLEIAQRLLKSYERHIETLMRDQDIQQADKDTRKAVADDLQAFQKRLAELEKKLRAVEAKNDGDQKPADAAKGE